MSRNVEITIWNRKFTLKSDEDEAQLREVARFVDDKLAELGRNSASAMPVNVAVLGALNIANEYFNYRRRMERALQDLELESDTLLALIDAELGED